MNCEETVISHLKKRTILYTIEQGKKDSTFIGIQKVTGGTQHEVIERSGSDIEPY